MRALGAVISVAAVSIFPAQAAACGCFAPATTVDPVIQAGERIAFSVDGNTVTAYVQIRFQGNATDFGWLVPVPAVPEVKAGTDELFEALDAPTRPRFQLTTNFNSACFRGGGGGFLIGCGSAAGYSPTGAGGGDENPVGSDPLVLKDTTGPYEYAVLKADSQAELQTWLQNNRYFIPATSDAALAPYVRPGAFFLALKLRAGQTAGDLRPVVLKYTSSYAMVPLVLTSATATPNMGVQVFMLGSSRAIPRNYHHVVLNTLKLDWATAANYGALVTAAVAEAPKKHAFITEYAGPSSVVAQLAPYERFGNYVSLENTSTPWFYVQYLEQHGFGPNGTGPLPDALLSVLEKQLPYPPGFAAAGITREQFFQRLETYLDPAYQAMYPERYMGWPGSTFDPMTLTALVWSDYVQPILDADRLVASHPYLTRMFTTISPEDMTDDPVFAFNPTLPELPALRTAIRVTGCEDVSTTFKTAEYDVTDESRLPQDMPSAARIEVLSEEGPPVEVSRYTPELKSKAPPPHGCAVADGAFFAVLAVVWLLVRRRKIS